MCLNLQLATDRKVNCSAGGTLLWPHRLQPARLLCPWNFPGKNTGVGCHSFCRGSSPPRDWIQVSCIAGSFFTAWATRRTGNLREGDANSEPSDSYAHKPCNTYTGFFFFFPFRIVTPELECQKLDSECDSTVPSSLLSEIRHSQPYKPVGGNLFNKLKQEAG